MKHPLLIATLVAATLAGCSKLEAPSNAPAAQSAVAVSAAASAQVRAPAPPAPLGGGKAAPEISADQLEKIRAELAKIPPPVAK